MTFRPIETQLDLTWMAVSSQKSLEFVAMADPQEMKPVSGLHALLPDTSKFWMLLRREWANRNKSHQISSLYNNSIFRTDDLLYSPCEPHILACHHHHLQTHLPLNPNCTQTQYIYISARPKEGALEEAIPYHHGVCAIVWIPSAQPYNPSSPSVKALITEIF